MNIVFTLVLLFIRVRNGRTILLDCSYYAVSHFGVKPFQRANTPAGTGTSKRNLNKVIDLVMGVDQEHGFLWFQLDKDMKDGLSYWDDITNSDTLICKGITLSDELPSKHLIPLPKVSEDILASIQNVTLFVVFL